jgi:hypothetical protein
MRQVDVTMQRVPVDSSSIAAIGYDPEGCVLEIEFRLSGQIYRYFGVPAEDYAAFLSAESKGSYLNQKFKPRGYPYLLLRTA